MNILKLLICFIVYIPKTISFNLCNKYDNNIFGCYSIPNCEYENTKCTYTSQNPLKILFVGNSFTSRNNMVNNFNNIINEQLNQKIFTWQHASGGWTLSMHNESWYSRYMMSRLNWNYIILQEQSLLLSYPYNIYKNNVIPYVESIKRYASTDNILLFNTWGYKDGNPNVYNRYNDDYYKMQIRLNSGYKILSNIINASIVPIGQGFLEAYPIINLYEIDGRHPNIFGSYLVSLIFFGHITGISPKNVNYIPSEIKSNICESLLIQDIADYIITK